MTVPKGSGGIAPQKFLEDRLSGHRDPHRQESGCQSFGERDQIGLNACSLGCKQGAAATKACQHLISDQQAPGLANQLFHGLQKARPDHAHASGSLDQRFQDHSCCWGLQRLLQDSQGVLFALIHRVVVPVCVRPGHPRNGKQKRIEGLAEEAAGSDGHRAEGVAVISALKSDQLLAGLSAVVPPLHGGFQSHLHRRGSVVREEHAIEAGVPGQSLGEPFGLGMGEFREDHLLQRGRLLGDGCRHHRVSMAMQGDPPAADSIDQGGAFGAVQQRPFAPHHLLQWRCGGDGCEGWPEVGVVIPRHWACATACCHHGLARAWCTDGFQRCQSPSGTAQISTVRRSRDVPAPMSARH